MISIASNASVAITIATATADAIDKILSNLLVNAASEIKIVVFLTRHFTICNGHFCHA